MKDLMLMSTHSGVGKNFILTGLVRLLIKRGLCVSPFKGCAIDEFTYVLSSDLAISFGQAMQCAAADIEPEPAHSPLVAVLGEEPHVRLLGRKTVIDGNPIAFISREYDHCLELVRNSFEYLKSKYDLVLIEGAGSPSEPGLQELDIPNVAVARFARPVIIIMTEMYWGGGFAHLKGTFDLLPKDIQPFVCGFILNKAFVSGSASTFLDCIRRLEDLTQVPVIAVVPPFGRVTIPSEQILHPVNSADLEGLSFGLDEHATALAEFLDVEKIMNLISAASHIH
jgi:adenosylcobyric acid synthase